MYYLNIVMLRTIYRDQGFRQNFRYFMYKTNFFIIKSHGERRKKAVYRSHHGLIKYIGTKAKCRNLKIFSWKETLRQVFISGARIFKLLRSPRIDSKNQSRQSMYPGGLVRQPYSYLVPSPHRLCINSIT
jgi:hypothetical protein